MHFIVKEFKEAAKQGKNEHNNTISLLLGEHERTVELLIMILEQNDIPIQPPNIEAEKRAKILSRLYSKQDYIKE